MKQKGTLISSGAINTDFSDAFSLFTHSYLPSLPAAPPNYIQSLHRAEVNKFLLVSQQRTYQCGQKDRKT